LPTFLGGIQLKAFYLTNVPPIFGKKIFTVPWTTTDAFGFPIGFFHTFPLSKGGLGGISEVDLPIRNFFTEFQVYASVPRGEE
jgi:hypothetical protein